MTRTTRRPTIYTNRGSKILHRRNDIGSKSHQRISLRGTKLFGVDAYAGDGLSFTTHQEVKPGRWQWTEEGYKRIGPTIQEWTVGKPVGSAATEGERNWDAAIATDAASGRYCLVHEDGNRWVAPFDGERGRLWCEAAQSLFDFIDESRRFGLRRW